MYKILKILGICALLILKCVTQATTFSCVECPISPSPAPACDITLISSVGCLTVFSYKEEENVSPANTASQPSWLFFLKKNVNIWAKASIDCLLINSLCIPFIIFDANTIFAAIITMEKDLASTLSTLLNKKFDDVEKAIRDVLQRSGDLVKPTKRVKNFPSEVVAQNVFDFNHFAKSAAEMFRSMQEICVIVGHKNQGKPQFLFFLMRLLQELGELVVLLDPTLLLNEGMNRKK